MDVMKMNWFNIEEYLKNDDRAIISLGSVEQHAYLSVATDHILSSKLALEAGERTGVLVYPGLPYGMTPYFTAFPGTINLELKTYEALIRDVLHSLYASGIRRIFIINGHGGNSGAQSPIYKFLNTYKDALVQLHNWWATPSVMNAVNSYSKDASHASWMENFPWTRVAANPPKSPKPMLDTKHFNQLSSQRLKENLGDGSYGGEYERSDEDMLNIWRVALEEICELVERGWAN